MLIILVGAVPEYHIEPVTGRPHDDITQSVKFTEDVNSIVTEVSNRHHFSTLNKFVLNFALLFKYKSNRYLTSNKEEQSFNLNVCSGQQVYSSIFERF